MDAMTSTKRFQHDERHLPSRASTAPLKTCVMYSSNITLPPHLWDMCDIGEEDFVSNRKEEKVMIDDQGNREHSKCEAWRLATALLKYLQIIE
jgi:hypothetical protein